MTKIKHIKQNKGLSFSLIEVIIDFAVLSVVAVTILSLMLTNLRSASYAQMRVVAANLANDRIEMIRSLPYDDIATQHGPILPQKNLLDSEDLDYAGFRFTIKIDARYFDDPYDHLATDPQPYTDTSPIDYKKVTVSVYNRLENKLLSDLTTNIASKAAETASNTGILVVNVVDNPEIGNVPIQGAKVTITNPTLVASGFPTEGITVYTDDYGQVMVPMLPPAEDNSYIVSVTKQDYSTDTTLSKNFCSVAIDTSGATLNPIIRVQTVTTIQMQIRCLTDLEILVKDANGNPLPNTSIRVQSARLLCTDPKSKYDQWKTTDANGKILIPLIEHDRYNYTNN